MGYFSFKKWVCHTSRKWQNALSVTANEDQGKTDLAIYIRTKDGYPPFITNMQDGAH